MVNYFEIQVVFGLKSTNLKCATRREFLTKVSEFCNLARDEIEMFDVTSGPRKAISVNDLIDKMKVEIRNKCIALGSTANGLRSGKSETEENLRPPDKDMLLKKFRENNPLTGLERKFLSKLVEDYYDESTSTHKRKSSEDDPPQTSNKKVQVFQEQLKQLKTTQTQTEEFRTTAPETHKSSPKRDLQYEGKLLALEAKKDPAKVDKIMKDTFDVRRNFILIQNPCIALVREKYPLLFTLSEVRNELNRIFFMDKDTEFLANIEKYSDAILSIVDEFDPLLKTINNKIKGAVTPIQKKYAKEVGALLITSNLLKERRMFLKTEDESWPADNYPRIEAPCKVHKLFLNQHMYKIVVEGHTLCEASTFQEAMLCLMAGFFIFNISYPEAVFNTLVVFEKIFLEANDTDSNEIDDQTSQIIKLIQLKTATKKT